MDRVTIGQYGEGFKEGVDIPTEPPSTPLNYRGWIETPNWILWESKDGTLYVANGRHPKTGALLGKTEVIFRARPSHPAL